MSQQPVASGSSITPVCQSPPDANQITKDSGSNGVEKDANHSGQASKDAAVSHSYGNAMKAAASSDPPPDQKTSSDEKTSNEESWQSNVAFRVRENLIHRIAVRLSLESNKALNESIGSVKMDKRTKEFGNAKLIEAGAYYRASSMQHYYQLIDETVRAHNKHRRDSGLGRTSDQRPFFCPHKTEAESKVSKVESEQPKRKITEDPAGYSKKKAKISSERESSPSSIKRQDLSQTGIENTVRELLRLTWEQLECVDEEIFEFVKDFRPLRRQLEKDVNGASEILNYDIFASLMDCIVSNLGGISTMDQNKSQQIQETLRRQQSHFNRLKKEMEVKKPNEANLLKKEVRKLTEELSGVRNDHEKLKAVTIQQESEAEARETEIKKLIEDGETAIVTLQSLNEKTEKLGESLTTCQAENVKLKNQVKTLEETLKSTRSSEEEARKLLVLQDNAHKEALAKVERERDVAAAKTKDLKQQIQACLN